MGTEVFLEESGYSVVAAGNAAALAGRITKAGCRPDLLVSDYRLGVETAPLAVARIMAELGGVRLPVVITTGDTSPAVRDDITGRGWLLLHKPYRPTELLSLLLEVKRGSA